MDIWGGEEEVAVAGKMATDVSKQAPGILNMFEHLNSGYQTELGVTETEIRIFYIGL
jgi:hypothetical protein